MVFTITVIYSRKIQLHWNFVDFKAAFDTIWGEVLWKCLCSIGVDPKLVDLIARMYEKIKCSVMVNGKITKWFEVQVGVRQGCLLSPCLFNIYLEFVMKEIQNLDLGLKMGNMCMNNIRYADDTTLIEMDLDSLQEATNKLQEACTRWGMKINPTKCKIISEDTKDVSTC
ncbi:hypothetical protein BSL78_17631 [Apostichopus japonicus]|uniref:Reverse transcriptase domain-containing protein n=1 Tax=Stichopus japonicus TaxID=307972 RepID=A0A2G8KBZ7_STIJA|nr:hypothetical protein BSL78_17631 [Apostichopus japonicus]